MKTEIKVGDTVQLASGGPKMTVTAFEARDLRGESYIWCKWFDRDLNLKAGIFPVSGLRKTLA